MDFELKHLEMVQGDSSANNSLAARSQDLGSRSIKSSQVLEDLTGQIEELQNRLKVSYRKLLLYETENQKLIQEKNAFFFENKMYAEHNTILVDKNKTLQDNHDEMNETIKKYALRIEISDKLIQTQRIDLGRLSKFHEKVKGIIKPFVENLKKQIVTLTLENSKQNNIIIQLENLKDEHEKKIKTLEEQINMISDRFAQEKVSLVQSYEEQIHFLSKEIVEQQQKALDANNENLRLKKQVETKHFIENELVKYKRDQDQSLQTINSLRIKESDLARQLTESQLSESKQKNQVTIMRAEMDQQRELLDATRKQLSLRITDIEDMTLRLKMLEKLNSNLSLNLKDHQT